MLQGLPRLTGAALAIHAHEGTAESNEATGEYPFMDWYDEWVHLPPLAALAPPPHWSLLASPACHPTGTSCARCGAWQSSMLGSVRSQTRTPMGSPGMLPVRWPRCSRSPASSCQKKQSCQVKSRRQGGWVDFQRCAWPEALTSRLLTCVLAAEASLLATAPALAEVHAHSAAWRAELRQLRPHVADTPTD